MTIQRTFESSIGSATPMMRSEYAEGTITGSSSVPKGAFTQSCENRFSPFSAASSSARSRPVV